MRRTITAALAVLMLAFAPAIGFAGGHANWTLVPEDSKIAFGSVKKDKVGESHHFSGLTGMVSEGGDVTIAIDLASVETWIDIRNERVREFVFHGMGAAELSAKLDMAALTALPVGGTATVPVNGNFKLMGTDVAIATDMFVVRLAENRVMVLTDEMFWIGTGDLGIDAGVDKLMELAKLPGITRTVPVTARLVFTK